MKPGWELKKLGDVCALQNGFAFKSKLFKPSGVPVLRISSIQNDSICDNRPVFVDPSDYKENLDKYKVVDDDLLIAMSGATTGKVGFNQTGLTFLLNQRVGKFEPSEHLEKRYLYFYLSTKVQENLEISAGAAQPNLSTHQIKEFQIPLPPLEEQKRIVSILDKAFEGLDRARENAEANLKSARELFRETLRAVFLDGASKWSRKLIPEVCLDFGRGKSKHRPRNDPSLYGGNIPFLQTGDLTNANRFIKSVSQFYSQKGMDQSKLWPTGTVCIAIVGATIGETGITTFATCFPDSVIGMTPDPQQADSEFIEFLLQNYKAELKKVGEGSARDNINLGTFQEIAFPIPDIRLQNELTGHLKSVAGRSEELQVHYRTKLQDISDLRQSLLQKAFAGELT